MESYSCIVCLLLVSSSLGAITFDGLKTSFAQYRRWQPSSSSRGVVGTLSLHFKAHLKDSLLLYQDDGINDYLSIELSNGRVVTTFRTAGKSVRIELGQDLVDMNWHIIVVQLNIDRLTLTLDKRLTKMVANGSSSRSNALIGSSGYLYIGGLPRTLSLSSLSWPGAAFKKGFVGCIKKLMMTNDENLSEKAKLVKSKGTKGGCLNECRARNPCQNKGKCVNNFSRPKCDCTGTGFEGQRCEKEIVRLHLSKKDYVIFDMSSNPSATQSDYVSVLFKTSKRNGVLLKTSFAQDYVIIKLFKGTVVVNWNLGSGRLEMTVGGKVHDNQWHNLNISRTKRIVTATLDKSDEVQGTAPPRHSTFNMHGGEGKVYIGGDQFEGCLQRMLFNGVEMISGLKAKDPRLSVQGKASWTCIEASTEASLTIPSSASPSVSTVKAATRSRSRNFESKRTDKISSDRDIKSVPKFETTNKPLKTTEHVRKTTRCSPNDVRCVLNTFPTSRHKPTSKRSPGKPTLCENNCTKGSAKVDKKRLHTDPTANTTTTTASEPEVAGLEGEENELGNVPTAVGLVGGSIVLFAFCAFVSVKLKQRRDRKSHVHEVTVEHREIDEMIETHVYQSDSHLDKN